MPLSPQTQGKILTALGQPEGVVEVQARAFKVLSSNGRDRYDVTLREDSASCTCEAGRNGVTCWHVRAAIARARATDGEPETIPGGA